MPLDKLLENENASVAVISLAKSASQLRGKHDETASQ
jgi:hypothetical protein